jgi:hypothetical protein
MQPTAFKRYTTDDIQEIKYVQNISGGQLRLPDLSEDRKPGNGVSLDVDEVLQLSTVVSEEAKLRSRDLRKGLEGSPASRSFDAIAPMLRPVEGFDDPNRRTTAIVGSTMAPTGSVTAPSGEFQIKILELQLKDTQYELKTTKNLGAKASLELTVVMLAQKIADMKKTTKTGLASNVLVVSDKKASEVL